MQELLNSILYGRTYEDLNELKCRLEIRDLFLKLLFEQISKHSLKNESMKKSVFMAVLCLTLSSMQKLYFDEMERSASTDPSLPH